LHCQLASPITTPTCHPVISRASHQHVVEAFQALVRAVVNSLLTHLPQPYCVRLCISTSALGVATAHGAGVPWAHRLMHTWRGMRRLLSAYYSILVATPGGPGLLQDSLGMGFDVPCNLAFSSFAWFAQLLHECHNSVSQQHVPARKLKEPCMAATQPMVTTSHLLAATERECKQRFPQLVGCRRQPPASRSPIQH
jgi:hypothetical protein